ncbi:hypothetical protein [Terriglobus roseus]|uniref:Uncharacterized protein n=1 Tax=Terriglobus roseus TaxID=392734 RepID=A0A1G7GMJ0_9BACT|nr:hypothetical protein [Terriglobus roseus]SDE89367.1 hypothetical protein SAMN05444167_0744 [Terriglobus roseus]
MGHLANAFSVATVSFMLAVAPAIHAKSGPADSRLQSATTSPTPSDPAPTLLTPAQVEHLMPATVYYRGQSAPIQLRNSAGARFTPDGYLLVAMVDTSGYASSVQEIYQMYLITESTLMIGDRPLGPGAYGAGVVNGKFIVTDVGGHTLLQADTNLDQSMPRPRPLQLLSGPAGGLKLYLGRSWVSISVATATH